MSEAQALSLQGLLQLLSPSEVHHGDCIGADAQCHEMALRVAVIHPPSDPKKRAFCTPCTPGQMREPKPYLERNRDIVDESELLIACPRQQREVIRSGTWATVRYARSQGKRVWTLYPDGTTQNE